MQLGTFLSGSLGWVPARVHGSLTVSPVTSWTSWTSADQCALLLVDKRDLHREKLAHYIQGRMHLAVLLALVSVVSSARSAFAG